MELLPRDVPEGLSAPEYYRLALEYKKLGWTEQARDALMLAIEVGGASEIAESARLCLKTKIPRYPVPLLAEQRFIEGFNQMATGDSAGAFEIFAELIKDYPDFEWPYGQLSVLCADDEDYERAKELLKKALEINPNYVNGWLQMAQVNGLENDFMAAKESVARALQVDPTDSAARAMKEELDKLDQ